LSLTLTSGRSAAALPARGGWTTCVSAPYIDSSLS
jgi:hypothetical protein